MPRNLKTRSYIAELVGREGCWLSPDLESHVAGELSKETATLKGRRKAPDAQKELGGVGGPGKKEGQKK